MHQGLYLLKALEASGSPLFQHALHDGALHLIIIAQGIHVLRQPSRGGPWLQGLRVRYDHCYKLRPEAVTIDEGLGHQGTPHIHVLNLLWGYVLTLHHTSQSTNQIHMFTRNHINPCEKGKFEVDSIEEALI